MSWQDGHTTMTLRSTTEFPELITSYGIAVLTEDSISPLKSGGTSVKCHGLCGCTTPTSLCGGKLCQDDGNLDLIQLNSFGCGLDAVTTDEVSDILTGSGKIYTSLKIDEVNNLGAARIRIRSLLAAIRVRTPRRKTGSSQCRDPESTVYERDEEEVYDPLPADVADSLRPD